MNHDLLVEIREIQDHLDLLEHQFRFVEADEYAAKNRWALDYDYNGNYCGAVANENGWTQ